MEKIFLALFVAITGSFLLPAMRLGHLFVSSPVPRSLRRETVSDVKKQIDHVPLAPPAGAKGWRFHPLTPEEKKEFVAFRGGHLRSAATSTRR